MLIWVRQSNAPITRCFPEKEESALSLMPDTSQAEIRPSINKPGSKLGYGWVIAVAGAIIMFVNAQFLYSFGVFVRPLIDNFGWSRGAVSSISSARSIITALLSPAAGTLTDRYGSKKLIIMGVFLCGLAFILSWHATSLWQFYLTLGVLIGLSNSIIITPTLAMVNRWFSGKSSLANGIAMTGPSMAQVLVPPAVTFLLLRYGWGTSLVVIGVTIWVLGSLSLSFFKNPPAAGTSQPHDGSAPATGAQHTDGASFTTAEALHTRTFWLLFSINAVTALCFQAVVVHVVVAAMDIGAAPKQPRSP